MAINLNDNIAVLGAKPTDARYLDNLTPYASVGAAETAIAANKRYTGLTVNIDGEEYWFKDGIENGDLVQKALGGTSNLSGATNGLSLVCSNTYVALGGALSQNTAICGAYSLSLGDYVSGLTAISAVTPTFQITDEGVNSSLSWCHDQDTPHFDVCLYGENADSCADIILDVDVSQGCFVAGSAPNSICCSAISIKTTDSNVAIYNVHSTNNVMHYVKEACIASSKQTYESLTDSGNAALNIKSVMNYDTRSWEFCKDNSTILSVLSGGTARYGSNVTLTNDCDLAHKWYVDNAAGALSAANGLTRTGDTIVLGGALTGATTISGAGNNFNVTGASCINLCSTLFNVVYGDWAMLMGSNCNVSMAYNCAGNTACKSGIGFNEFFNAIQDDVHNCGISYLEDYSTLGKTCSLWIPDWGSVTGLTSGITGAITSANNGLCVSGQVVSLGGTLTGNTTIAGDNNVITFNGLNGFDITSVSATTCGTTSILLRSPSFTVHNGIDNVISISSACNLLTDTANSEGFAYANNYCTNGKTNPRWIPDNAYVTGLTSGFFNTASNGLTKDLQDVKLGGTLCEATNICLGGGGATQSFQIQNSGVTACNVFNMNGTTVDMCASNVNSPNQTGRVAVASSAALMCHGFSNCYSCLNMSNSLVNLTFCGGSSNAQMTVTDATSTQRGIEYAACYHSTYSDRSLVDKGYVTSVTSGTTGAFTSANNGLCSSGQIVSLGGSLTGNTTIDPDGNSITIGSTYNKLTIDDGASPQIAFQSGTGLTGTLGILGLNGEACTVLSAVNALSSKALSFNIDPVNGCMGVVAQSGATITDLTVCFDGMSINSTAAGFVGIEYGGDYCANFGNCSLVTKEYVDNATGGLGGENGLTRDGDNIVLGGSLTGTTCIGTAGNSFCIEGRDSNSEFTYVCSSGISSGWEFTEEIGDDALVASFKVCESGGYPFIKLAACDTSTANRGELRLQDNRAQLMYFSGGTKTASLCLANACTVFSDSINSQGIQYQSCYHDNYTDRTLVDKEYVTSQVSGITGAFTTANNGLQSLSSQVVSLGGNLTGDTTIIAGDNKFEVTGEHNSGIAVDSIGGSRTASIYAGSGTTITGLALTASAGGFTTFSQLSTSHVGGECATLCSVAASSGTESSWRICDGSSANEIKIESSGEMTVTDTINSKGFVYGDDYEPQFTDRSLVTKKFTVDCINTLTGVTSNAITGATNGLIEVDNDVKLGGILSEETVISGNSQTLRLGSLASCLQNFYVDATSAVQIQSGSIYLNAGSGGANYKGGNFCIQLDNTNATFCDNSTGKDGLKYAACISTGFTNSCSVVDKGYVDDNANILQVCQINSGYTTVRSDDLIVVSGISTNEINLYPTPELGQRLTVVDICGNALAEPIVVNGNGKLINNSVCSSINTDYGSVTYVYNGIFWSAVAFIN